MGRGVAALVLIVTLGAAGASAAREGRVGAWPQYRFGPAHTGATPYEHVLTRLNVARLRPAWRFKTGGAVWSSPAVQSGVVYIGSNDKHIYALQLSDGKELWDAAVGGRPSAPAIADDVVYVVGDDAFAYAFDALTGKRLWRTSLNGFEGAFPAAPTVVDGVVYAMDEGISALDAQTGQIRWQRLISCFACPVAFANHSVYIAGSDIADNVGAARLFALDPETGITRWSTALKGMPAFTPSIRYGMVYVGLDVDQASGVRPWAIAAFDALTGAARWRTPVGRSKYLTFSSTAVADGRAFFPSPPGKLVALDAKTGRYVWRVAFKVTNSAPGVANGVVYIGSTDTYLYAFDVRTGRRLWHVKTGGEITSSPTVANGTVLVGSDDGVVRAFRLRAR